MPLTFVVIEIEPAKTPEYELVDVILTLLNIISLILDIVVV